LTTGRTINSQRIALLRLLAGWEVVLAVLPCAALCGSVSLRLRGFLAAMVFRAELATGYLVVATLRGLIRRGAVQADGFDAAEQVEALAVSLIKTADWPDEALSVHRLRLRLRALKRDLADLPRAALRMLQMLADTVDADESESRAGGCAERRGKRTGGKSLRPVLRIERPPDKGCAALVCAA